MTNLNKFDAEFDAMLSKLDKPQKALRKGAVATSLTIFLFALALTVAGLVLSFSVSLWFLIAVAITAFYTVVSGIALITMLAVTKNF